jgi:hypothetical protein
MSMRRVVGIFILALIIIAMMLLIWYIGSQKTVYGLVAPCPSWARR